MALETQTGTESNTLSVPLLKAFLLYEDRATGLYAKESLDRFAHRVDFDLEYRLDVCRFDLLEDSNVRVSTAEQAAEADIVVLALRSGHDVPAGPRDWFNHWLRLKGDRTCALVILICDAPTSVAGAAQRRSDFIQIPPHANVEVFECVRSLDQAGIEMILQQLRFRENSSSEILDEILHRGDPFTHWGIND
jgi:hypothetical protein